MTAIAPVVEQEELILPAKENFVLIRDKFGNTSAIDINPEADSCVISPFSFKILTTGENLQGEKEHLCIEGMAFPYLNSDVDKNNINFAIWENGDMVVEVTCKKLQDHFFHFVYMIRGREEVELSIGGLPVKVIFSIDAV